MKIRPPVQKLDNSEVFCPKTSNFSQKIKVFTKKTQFFGRKLKFLAKNVCNSLNFEPVEGFSDFKKVFHPKFGPQSIENVKIRPCSGVPAVWSVPDFSVHPDLTLLSTNMNCEIFLKYSIFANNSAWKKLLLDVMQHESSVAMVLTDKNWIFSEIFRFCKRLNLKKNCY